MVLCFFRIDSSFFVSMLIFSITSRISTPTSQNEANCCRVVTALSTSKLARHAGGPSLISISSFSSSSEGSILIQFAQATHEVGFEIKHLYNIKFELERFFSSGNKISCSN